ncbi:MAG: DNA repair protein RadC [Candidatus Eremiobacterota bacterium]
MATPYPIEPPSLSPRERLLRLGARSLQDWELITLITGASREVARQVSLEALPQLRVKGLGPARAAALEAAVELGRRLNRPGGPPVTSPEEAFAQVHDMAELPKEHFRALYLDSRRRLMAAETVSVGTLTASLVHPREVFQPAIARSAAAVVVAHNHPSGDPEPSFEDLALTRRLRQSGEILGIDLLDHLVVGRSGWVSLKELGHL